MSLVPAAGGVRVSTMTLFEKIFGHKRDEAGKSLDRLVFGCIIVGTLIGLYACYG